MIDLLFIFGSIIIAFAIYHIEYLYNLIIICYIIYLFTVLSN